MEEAVYKEEPWIELIDGKICMMSPRPRPMHNRVINTITTIFENYLWDKPCQVFSDGVDVYLDEKNHFIPDAMIICNTDIIHPNGIYGAPDLVVEVLSPRTTKNDRTKKLEAYARAGVKEYWIVSPLERSVEVYLQQDGQLVLDTVYNDVPDWEYEKMEPEDQAEIHRDIKVSIYDDLIIHISDVFHKIDV
jgi:Uma2 family endonuclease